MSLISRIDRDARDRLLNLSLDYIRYDRLYPASTDIQTALEIEDIVFNKVPPK